MILTRLGNKTTMAVDIWKYFPPHKMRIELFFGAGGAFFNMPPAKYNILNDLDDDVVNLFLVLQTEREALYHAIKQMPIASSLLKHYKMNHGLTPIEKAVRFILISNFTYLGKGDTLRLGVDNTKHNLLLKIEKTFKAIENAKITNYDFRDVISKISFSPTVCDRNDAFVYLDPVYLETDHYYKVPAWTEADSIACFDIMSDSGMNCAMSEFAHPFIIKEAEKRGFNIVSIRERQNIKNRKTEILITNYHPQNLLF